MIRSLTDKQWSEISKICKNILDEQTKQFSESQIRDNVAKIYKKLDKNLNSIIFVMDSPLSCLISNCFVESLLKSKLDDQLSGQLAGQLADQLAGQLSGQLRGQLRGQLSGQLRGQLTGQLTGQLLGQLHGQLLGQLHGQLHGQLSVHLRGQLTGQLTGQLHGQLHGQLNGQLGGRLGSQLRGQLDGQLKENLNSINYLILFWYRYYKSYDDIADFLKLDKKDFTDYLNFIRYCCFIIPNKNIVFVSKNPIKIFWENNLLSNNNGPSIEWVDGYKIWSLDGINVDEQLVMKPETQTIKQIHNEKNADLRQIRIQRLGWPRYLKQTKSIVLDKRKDCVANTQECLIESDIGELRLVVTCPTKRIFAIGVPKNIKTCEEAQNWLKPRPVNVLIRT